MLFPIGDDNPTLRTPVVTYALLGALLFVWVFIQGAGLDGLTLAQTVCELGLVPGEITQAAEVGVAVPIGEGLACVVDREAINSLTPLTSMFLHGSWGHLLGNGLFLWVFGNNVEDSMGRLRFVVFYILCGLAAATAQVLVNTASPVPMVGASGAISGVLGGYLVLYPRVHVRILFFFFIFIRIFHVPALFVLLFWIGYQVVLGLPQLAAIEPDVSSGVAFWAHIGGFAAGVLLIKLFARSDLVALHREALRRHYSPWQRSGFGRRWR